MSNYVALTEGYFKRGSTWQIALTRKDSTGAAIDMTGLDTRIMFREGGVDGTVIVTLTEGTGITIDDPATGLMDIELTATQTALFTAGAKVYFDVEQTNSVTGYVWQSQTYRLTVMQEVTRG